jgi:hypothetical protein
MNGGLKTINPGGLKLPGFAADQTGFAVYPPPSMLIHE